MPYILVHPIPPPRKNPYKPGLPTFTTSSRSVAHFFHSHGWRARHVHCPPSSDTDTTSLPSSLTFSRTPSRHPSRSTTSSDYVDALTHSHVSNPAPNPSPCCLASSDSSLVSCGTIAELHTYLIPITSAIFHGPPATRRQVNYLLYYAHPHISFEDADGDVDLHVPNLEALALQRYDDAAFWRKERKSERWRKRKAQEGEAEMVKTKWGAPVRDLPNRAWSARTQQTAVAIEKRMRLREMIEPRDTQTGLWRKDTAVVVTEEEEEEDDEECSQLVSADQDEEIDDELGEQWKTYERALLASEGLEWEEVGKTLRKTRDAI